MALGSKEKSKSEQYLQDGLLCEKQNAPLLNTHRNNLEGGTAMKKARRATEARALHVLLREGV